MLFVETLPRTKKRVRKASAEPRMTLTPDLFMTPPMSRINRSMSNPVTSLELSSSSPLLTRSMTPTVAEEPDVLNLDMSESSLLGAQEPAVHELPLDTSTNKTGVTRFTIGSDSFEDSLGAEIDKSSPQAPIELSNGYNLDNLLLDTAINENSTRFCDIKDIPDFNRPSRSVASCKVNLPTIPSVEITDTDACSSSTLTESSKLDQGAKINGAKLQEEKNSLADGCMHGMDRVSAYC